MGSLINKFEFVSPEQYKKSILNYYKLQNGINDTDEKVEMNYDVVKKEINKIIEVYPNKKPQRSTEFSAGYDFYAPFDIKIPFGESLVIPTGIKCSIQHDMFLALFPRSGQGFKYGITITNTVGIIDSDYYNNDNNEGHIMVKITNNNNSIGKDFEVKSGEAFCQGIFIPYGRTVDDDMVAKSVRSGGFGSTDKDDNNG